jgi:hypothetical protein
MALVCCAMACAPEPSAQRAPPGVPPPLGRTRVDVRVTAVPLNSDAPGQRSAGRFVYAGGLELAAEAMLRFGGLSDLDVSGDGRLLSVTDEGQLVEARIVLDAAGNLTGLADASMTPLVDEKGLALRDKSEADAEGITVLPNGDRLVSFERRHRVWRYPAGGAPPVPAPAPAAAAAMPLNGGMEALSAFPAAGAGTYLVGGEGGMVWLCDLAGACRETALGSRVPSGYGLTAVAVSPDGQTLALVSRAFDPVQGVRAIVRLLARGALTQPDAGLLLDELALVAPLTRDNFEGVALVSRDAGLRLYLLSDNNYSAAQHTYLLAFDWRPS